MTQLELELEKPYFRFGDVVFPTYKEAGDFQLEVQMGRKVNLTNCEAEAFVLLSCKGYAVVNGCFQVGAGGGDWSGEIRNALVAYSKRPA